MTDQLLAKLRGASIDDVVLALDGAYASPPIATPAQALQFFHCMLDVLTDRGGARELPAPSLGEVDDNDWF